MPARKSGSGKRQTKMVEFPGFGAMSVVTDEKELGMADATLVDEQVEPAIEEPQEVPAAEENAEPVVVNVVSADDALYDETAQDIPAESPKARKQRKAKEAGTEGEPKPKREPSPYAGLSGHQRNRKIALAKYGTRVEYVGNDFIIRIQEPFRSQIQAKLDAGVVRPSAKGKSHGGDRYLSGLAKMGWPADGAVIVYPDQREELKAERDAAKANKAVEREALKLQKAAEREAAKLAKQAEREAAKQAKLAAEAVEAETADIPAEEDAAPATEFEPVA